MPDTGFGLPHGDARSRQMHRPYRFVVALGYEQMETHCPVCLATSDGWYEDGQPRYQGGWVTLRHVTDKTEWTYRCRCWVGRLRGEKMKLYVQPIPNHPMPEFENPLPLGWVLWDRNTHPTRPPSAHMPPAQARIRALAPKAAAQIQRALRHEIDGQQLAENLRILAERAGLPAPPKSPTLNDVLGSSALTNLYWPGG